jgi:hypothetical protein
MACSGKPSLTATLVGCLAVAFGLAVLSLPWLPSSDLSLHEGMVALLARHGDPAFAPPGVYALSLGHPNQLLYALALPPAAALGSRFACKLVVVAIAGATLVSAARLADHLGRSRWAAAAVCPAVVGWAFYHGFVPQLLGVALWLWALPLLDRTVSARDAVAASAATVLVGLAHATSLMCSCLACVVLALARPLDRRVFMRLMPAAAGVAMLAAEARWEASVQTPLARVLASRVLWHPVGTKLRALGANLVGPHGAVVESTLGLLVVVAVVLWRRSDAGDAPGTPVAGLSPGTSWLERHRFAVVAGALFGAYLVAPYSVNFGALLYVRFLAPAYIVAVVLLGPPRGARGPLLVAPALALLIAPALVALPQVAAAARQFSAVQPLIARIDEGSAVAVLHFGKHDRSLSFDATSVGNRVLAERGGRLLSSFAEFPIAPVVIRPEAAWDTLVMRLAAAPGGLCPAHDLRRLRWLLVHVFDVTLVDPVVRGLAPEGRLVAAEGEWLLFRSTLPPLPLTTPDAEPPAEAETLETRVKRLLAAP